MRPGAWLSGRLVDVRMPILVALSPSMHPCDSSGFSGDWLTQGCKYLLLCHRACTLVTAVSYSSSKSLQYAGTVRDIHSAACFIVYERQTWPLPDIILPNTYILGSDCMGFRWEITTGFIFPRLTERPAVHATRDVIA